MKHVKWIVDQMHVHTSDTDVIREIYRKFREDSKGVIDKRSRRKVYTLALEIHHNNQNLYKEIYPSNPPIEEEVTEAMNDPVKREEFLERYGE